MQSIHELAKKKKQPVFDLRNAIHSRAGQKKEATCFRFAKCNPFTSWPKKRSNLFSICEMQSIHELAKKKKHSVFDLRNAIHSRAGQKKEALCFRFAKCNPFTSWPKKRS